MTPRSRRVLLAAGGLALFLVGVLLATAWRTTRSTLDRAEAFRFRRMLVSEIDDGSAYRFFFATNRRSVSGDGPVADGFEAERADRLTFGSFDTSIEPSLGLGMLLDASDWFRDEEIRIRGTHALAEGDFVREMTGMVRASPQRSLLIVVHGFREAFDSALRKTAFLGHVLDINTPVLVFDWPGNQGSSLRGYRRASQVATESGAELAELLRLVVLEIEPERIWLVANSMGGQVVVDAVERLYLEDDFADEATEIEDVVLTAPDVDDSAFDEQFKLEIAALTRNLTVYVSANDRALLMSRVVNRQRRAGESSLGGLDPDQFAEAARITELIDPDHDLVTLVDVTPVNRTRNFHNFSLETPEFFDDLFLRLTSEPTPTSRLVYPLRTPKGRLYWVLTRGR